MKKTAMQAVWLLLVMTISLAITPDVLAQGIGAVSMHRGYCFSYPLPAGWQCNDTMNGVDIWSPDKSEYVFLSLLERMPGRQTPEGFLRLCSKTTNAQNLKIISVKPGPPVPMYQQSQIFEVTSTVNGVPICTRCVCAVSNGWGQWAAICQGYSAVATRFRAVAPVLENMALRIVATGGSNIAGRNTIMMPKNNPNTAGDTIMQSWNYRNHVMDRISQQREEATLGISRQKDPLTGRIYDMPQSRFDPTRGGYVNPARPTELLQHVQPGE